jgi:hypothetical protein
MPRKTQSIKVTKTDPISPQHSAVMKDTKKQPKVAMALVEFMALKKGFF